LALLDVKIDVPMFSIWVEVCGHGNGHNCLGEPFSTEKFLTVMAYIQP